MCLHILIYGKSQKKITKKKPEVMPQNDTYRVQNCFLWCFWEVHSCNNNNNNKYTNTLECYTLNIHIYVIYMKNINEIWN